MKKQFPFDEDPLGDDEDNEKFGIESLTSFSQLYAPATKDNLTDLFSTKEIQKSITDFSGVEIPVSTIYDLLQQMD